MASFRIAAKSDVPWRRTHSCRCSVNRGRQRMQPHISVNGVSLGLSTISSTRFAPSSLTIPNFSGRFVGKRTVTTSSSPSAAAHARANTSPGSMMVSAMPKKTDLPRTRW